MEPSDDVDIIDVSYRLGGEVVSNEVEAPGFKDAGYVNLTTSDGITHGQVRQSSSFSFVRIYQR